MVQSAEAAELPGSDVPSLTKLFVNFFFVSIIGFGGVMPWAYRMVVEQHRWMTSEEFAEVMAFSQFLPGGNIINFAVVLGQRFHGALGSTVCVVGLLLAPSTIVIMLATIYINFGQVSAVHDALGGVAAAAAGLILAVAAKMAKPLFNRKGVLPLCCAAVVFLCVALFRLPLYFVVAAVAPVSVAIAWRQIR